MTTRQARELITEAVQHWTQDRGARLAAAFSFYAVLAMAPLLVVAVAAASYSLDRPDVQDRVVAEVSQAMGSQAATLVAELIDQAAQPASSIIATILSLGVAVFAGSNLFFQLSETVSAIWGVHSPPATFKEFATKRAGSVLLLLAFGTLFLAWLVLDTWLGWAARRTGVLPYWPLVSQASTLVFLTLVFALSYRTLPRPYVRWCDVWFGAILAGVGFTVTKYLLSLYFAYSGVSAAYGSAGALVVILLWIYYTSQIYFFGLEVVYSYAHRFGSQRGGAVPPVGELAMRESH